MKKILLFFFSTFLFTSVVHAQQPTKVVVRALAKDAKFIGSSMEGALITIKDATSGEVLAKGRTKGSTGDTEKIVTTPKQRYETLSTTGSAKFVAQFNLKKPLFVTVSATGPMNYTNKKVTSTTQLWLIPGQDTTGDGIILELPGFVVNILKPEGEQLAQNQITIKTEIVMMCGCPTSPGGTWNSDQYNIQALVKRKGVTIAKVPLTYAGESSTYKATYTTRTPGTYQIMVYAHDSKTGNTGLDKVTVTTGSNQLN